MEEADILRYVQAAARLQGLALDTERAKAVALHLARTAALARLLDAAGLHPEDEPAEVYRPAPFPAAAPGEEGTA